MLCGFRKLLPEPVTATSTFSASMRGARLGTSELPQSHTDLTKDSCPGSGLATQESRVYHWFRRYAECGESYGKIGSNSGVSQAEGRALRRYFDQLHLKQ